MNVTVTQTQVECNSCKSVIQAANADGAVRLAGTTIDFCAKCAAGTVTEAAKNFSLPQPPAAPAGANNLTPQATAFRQMAKNNPTQAVQVLQRQTGLDAATAQAVVKEAGSAS